MSKAIRASALVLARVGTLMATLIAGFGCAAPHSLVSKQSLYHSAAMQYWAPAKKYEHKDPATPIYVIGFEKTKADPERGLRHQYRVDGNASRWDCIADSPYCLNLPGKTKTLKLGDQIAKFVKDSKVQWPTHVLRIEHNSSCLLFRTNEAFDAPGCSGVPPPYAPPDVSSAKAELETLAMAVRNDIASPKDRNNPPTHILVIATGWNTVQDESIKNFFDWTNELIEQSSDNFNPVVIGISWQSKWGGTENFWGLVSGIGSFANKSNDADEIGFTWANQLINRYLLPIASEQRLPVLLLGHSFGTRIIAGAVHGHSLIEGLPTLTPAPRVDFVALQPAFSVNRFISIQHEPLYTLPRIQNAQSVYTASSWDSATFRGNFPFSFFGVGKKPYLSSPQAVRGLKSNAPFYASHFERWEALCDADREPCRVRLKPPVDTRCTSTPVVDASAIIHGHSDVYHPAAATLIVLAANACR